MGGSSDLDEWEMTSTTAHEVCTRTVVLVGRTGNGKSSTGNSLLGTKKFNSKSSSASVTRTCELSTTVLENGPILNVIDTPGLFDYSAELEVMRSEIVKCIWMAKDGIHAVLVVLSVRSRFSREEEHAIESLRKLFGSKISDYMILVFTGGDDLEENDQTLDDYLNHEDNCPQPLQETLKMCGNRCLLFDNRTIDANKKSEQLKKLLRLVDDVVCNNGGKPYTDELFFEAKEAAQRHCQSAEAYALLGSSKEEISEFNEHFNMIYEEQLKRITKMVELKLRETTHKLEQQLAKAHAARLKAEAKIRSFQDESDKQIRKLRKNLEKAEREIEKHRRRAQEVKCAIL